MTEVRTVESFYVAPHQVVSREVKKSDVKRLLKDARMMYELCFAPVGIYKRAFAIAHPQITKEDPLRFFVTRDQRIIINPVIVKNTNAVIMYDEGCMTFYNRNPKKVARHNKCEVQFQTLDEDNNLTEPAVWPVKGVEAQMCQHEIDHLNGKYIYAS